MLLVTCAPSMRGWRLAHRVAAPAGSTDATASALWLYRSKLRGSATTPPSRETIRNGAAGFRIFSCLAGVAPSARCETTTVKCTVTGGAWTAFAQQGGSYHAKGEVDNPAYD